MRPQQRVRARALHPDRESSSTFVEPTSSAVDEGDGPVQATTGKGSVSTAVRREEHENVVPFKRGDRKVKRLRRSPLSKFLRPFVAALAIVAVPATLVAWPMTSPRFALAELTVETGERVSEAWIENALMPLMGRNVPLLSLPRVEGLLRQHPWVATADLRKDLPARLLVKVKEKQAVALLRRDGGEGAELSYLSRDGSPIASFEPLAGSVDFLLISLGAMQEAPTEDAATSLRAAIRLKDEIAEVAPSWATGLSEIVVLGEQDFEVYSTSLPFPLLLRVGTLDQKAHRLEALLPQIVERYENAAAIDLRFTRRIIVQPSVKTGSATKRFRGTAANREAVADHVQHG